MNFSYWGEPAEKELTSLVSFLYQILQIKDVRGISDVCCQKYSLLIMYDKIKKKSVSSRGTSGICCQKYFLLIMYDKIKKKTVQVLVLLHA